MSIVPRGRVRFARRSRYVKSYFQILALTVTACVRSGWNSQIARALWMLGTLVVFAQALVVLPYRGDPDWFGGDGHVFSWAWRAPPLGTAKSWHVDWLRVAWHLAIASCISGVSLVALGRAVRSKRHRTGRCLLCGYPRLRLDGACSECGERSPSDVE